MMRPLSRREWYVVIAAVLLTILALLLHHEVPHAS